MNGECVDGHPGPSWHCRFCDARLHRPGDCTCSQFRTAVTLYAPLCTPCALAVDELTADTVLGRVHRRLVDEARMEHMPSSDY